MPFNRRHQRRATPPDKIGDGKIFVTPLEQVSGKPHLRIRPGETGRDAV
ncbi:MAG: P-II family nitrogen regulator [Pseudomonadota bacterium]